MDGGFTTNKGKELEMGTRIFHSPNEAHLAQGQPFHMMISFVFAIYIYVTV